MYHKTIKKTQNKQAVNQDLKQTNRQKFTKLLTMITTTTNDTRYIKLNIK